MAPVLHFNLCLARFFHSRGKHGAEVLALGRKNGFVCVDLLALHHKYHIGELRIVDDFPHVLNKAIHRLVVDLILLQLADVQYANVI